MNKTLADNCSMSRSKMKHKQCPDIVRIITVIHLQALSWCRTMCSDKSSKDDRRKMFDAAIKQQTKVMLDNISGKGLDIPLLGLREGVKEAGLQEFQELFDHESYTTLNHFKLSTSQVPVALPMSFMGMITNLSSIIQASFMQLLNIIQVSFKHL